MKEREIHILVIDGNEDILTMLKVMLEYNGYKVSVKDNTKDVNTIVNDIQPHVIIMDKILSGSDGCEVCQQLKTDTMVAHIPLIMISAHPQAKEECLAAGADYFIEKPFEMNDLLKMVAGAVNTI